MPSRIREVVEAAAARVRMEWGPVGDDEVTTPYRLDICTDPSDPERLLEGRKVYVFPAAYVQAATASRGHDQNEYTVAALVVERYTDEGDPTDEWVNERVEFVEAVVYGPLQDPRRTRLLATTAFNGLWPTAAEVDPVYDPEELIQRKLFASLVRVTYQEIAEG